MVVPQTVSELTSKYTVLLGQVGEFLVVVAILYLPGRFVVKPAIGWVLARRNLEPTIERTIDKLLGLAITVSAIAIGAWASGFSAFLGGSALVVAALTLAVGFAAQDVLSNFVAGIFIVQDRNFKIDDWIQWDENAGIIEDIGFRVTRVRTFNNETITVPNTDLATNAVTNRMSKDTLRITYPFGIGYTDDIDEMTRLLMEVAAEHNGILADPSPSVRVTGLESASIELEARFWIEHPDRNDFSVIRSEYIKRVRDRCRAAGIDLSTTTQHDIEGDLSIHNGEPS